MVPLVESTMGAAFTVCPLNQTASLEPLLHIHQTFNRAITWHPRETGRVQGVEAEGGAGERVREGLERQARHGAHASVGEQLVQWPPAALERAQSVPQLAREAEQLGRVAPQQLRVRLGDEIMRC